MYQNSFVSNSTKQETKKMLPDSHILNVERDGLVKVVNTASSVIKKV